MVKFYLMKWKSDRKRHDKHMNILRIAIHKNIFFFLLLLPIMIILVSHLNPGKNFSGPNAIDNARTIMAFGPRTPGSQGHLATLTWLETQLGKNQWATTIQTTTINNVPINNVIAKRGEGRPWIILGSHYDSRIYADRDEALDNRTLPVPGANDGASSTALLVELSRIIPKNLNFEIWLVFFDAEDNGSIYPNDWIMGSRFFVNQLAGIPDAAVIVDMIGDRDLTLYFEKNSTPHLSSEIWYTARELGYSSFIPHEKHRMLDDHIPFLEAGIPAVDIIDFDYPYWHTTQDTIDKISSESLESVGRTIQVWLEKQK